MGKAWQDAFAADRPVVVEAVVDPAVPLHAPHLPDDKADMIYRGLAQEPGSDAVREQVLSQRADEGHDDRDRLEES
ncbi:hypothetical protein [Amycolatopsis sp. NPDC051371]|uniref:hypothetical protein n=1 Tax=Amycolatopsis sp. NPDC051371 TaxID=3155800 RepID=UPI00341B5D49